MCHVRKLHFFAMLLLAALLVTTPLRAEELARLLARIEAAYGAAGEVTAIRQHGRTVSRLRGDGAMERWWAAPDRFRIRLAYPGGTETRLMIGTRAWQGLQPKGGPYLQAMRLQAARSRLPWNLFGSDRVTLLGSRSDGDGRTVHTLALALQPPLQLLVDVDAENGHLLRSIGSGIGDMQFITEYRDFRRIGSHLVATREEHYAMGRHIGHSIILGLDFPSGTADEAFRPPE